MNVPNRSLLPLQSPKSEEQCPSLLKLSSMLTTRYYKVIILVPFLVPNLIFFDFEA